ncbi:putative hydrolase/uncharacterized protein, coenzyme F420 biosynthesis associated [Propionibacterium cyclohexanicum]|uniref:Putative hydrolase/uncharacterized protein, coenzyme F420 biosynthesis associated n=1 Tax=Propionibacterium cyclohexanicum TaxID=64702 RepID=A0A1H9RV28_9ACTN|nr:zinc-dependent metalloprotease [Propionibacterium cyclohexanicum]SER76566.1 putative hydrolase/uncharacterized protein, coenzyme F420 biosynthesis associated [Propionibacterium cyclohexanicum]
MGSAMPWVDWQAAVATACRVMPAGPAASQGERLDCVADLRQAAAHAPELVAEAARLPNRGEQVRELVVDRRGIVAANVSTAQELLRRLGLDARPPVSAPARTAGALRGQAIGVVLGAVAPRLLGQFDAFGPSQRLLLVAPNIMAVERQIGAVPKDFRAWVALHEQTHRVQFASAPWLLDWFVQQLARAIDDEPQTDLWTGLEARLTNWRRARARGMTWSAQLNNAASSPATVEVLDSIGAAMSLLEGHADVMMDRAALPVVPTLASIRSGFDRRRARKGPSSWLGRLIGMDSKLAQYRDGAKFCRAVIASGPGEDQGIELLNRVFEAPTMLPSFDELINPADWIARVGATRAP